MSIWDAGFLVVTEVTAREDTGVRIVWQLADGTAHVQIVVCPPKEIRDVRDWEQRMSQPRTPVPYVNLDETPLLRAKHWKR